MVEEKLGFVEFVLQNYYKDMVEQGFGNWVCKDGETYAQKAEGGRMNYLLEQVQQERIEPQPKMVEEIEEKMLETEANNDEEDEELEEEEEEEAKPKKKKRVKQEFTGDRAAVIKEVCESIARHYADDYVLNELHAVEGRQEKIKKLRELCKDSGFAGEIEGVKIHYWASGKGVEISEPFEESLTWTQAFNVIKDLDYEKFEYEYDSDIPECSEFVKSVEHKEHYGIIVVKYFSKRSDKRFEERVSIEDCDIVYAGDGMGSSYGSGGGAYDSEKLSELRERLLQFKRGVTETPYFPDADEHSHFLERLKAENVKCFIGEKAKEFLERNGFSVTEFYKEFNAITQRNADESDLAKEREFKEAEQLEDKLRNEVNAIEGFFREGEALGGEKRGGDAHYYRKKLDEFGIDYADLQLLKETYEHKKQEYEEVENKVYETRWGKPKERS